jgi:NAD-dependent dihydropyrimidine dehydrogenase PreA subunit
MCHLCDEYGDPEYGGGVWYLNPKNYARNMYKLRLPGEGFKGAEAGLETGERTGPTIEDVLEAIEKGQHEERDKLIQQMNDEVRGRGMENQVVPLRDAEKVLELCSPIGLIACICRKEWRGIDERNEFEYTCMGMGVGMLKWERWPERYKGGVKFVSVEEAKEWTRRMDKRGFVHLLMLFGAPYIGGFCQCDYPDCLGIRRAVDFGFGMLKSHYVAAVDYDICNGCGICAQRCQFGALKFEVTTEKANIDQFKCYGYGVCETGCPRGAIKLLERKNLPALAEVWT